MRDETRICIKDVIKITRKENISLSCSGTFILFVKADGALVGILVSLDGRQRDLQVIDS